jgi:hypothetical protein
MLVFTHATILQQAKPQNFAPLSLHKILRRVCQPVKRNILPQRREEKTHALKDKHNFYGKARMRSKSIRNTILILISLFLINSNGSMQTDTSKYTTRQIVQLSAASLSAQFLWNAELLIPAVRKYKNEAGAYPWYVPATLGLEPLPLYCVDKKEAFLINGLQAFFVTSNLVLTNTNPYTKLCMSENYLFTSMFSTYRIYNTMRRNSSDDYCKIPYYKTSDLMLAPFKPKNFLHPTNLITIGLVSTGMAIGYACSDRSNSIWNAKKTYYKNGKEIDERLGTGLIASEFLSHNFTKGFEEAFWRGMIYEDLKYRFNKPFLPRVFSSILFGLWHIAPMYTEYELPKNQIPLYVIGAMVGGYVISIIYDNYGLEAAATSHAWFNSTMGILDFLFFSGNYKKDVLTNDNNLTPPSKQLNMGFTIQF